MQNLKDGFLIKKYIRIKQVPPHETQSNIYVPLLLVPYNGPNSPLLTLSLILLFLLSSSVPFPQTGTPEPCTALSTKPLENTLYF